MRTGLFAILALLYCVAGWTAERTQKPVLHASQWLAITGKPLGATAGARVFLQGGNAVDAACAMLAATATMWDTLGWGGETQALIYNPHTRQIKGINALGVAPTGATAALFRDQGMQYPPEYGPLAAVTPGTPGGLLVMLAQYGKLSLAQVLAPAMDMAAGYPIEAAQADNIERRRDVIGRWPDSRRVLLPHLGEDPQARAAPYPGEIFRQPDLLSTLTRLVAAEAAALRAGQSRKQAIMAAYQRFYRGDIAAEIVRATQAAGGLITLQDLDNWQVHIEEPVSTSYRGVDVYKLTHWVQGPVMLQTLNILENMDIKALGYNTPEYIHALYQAMNLAYADRDFYYGDPYLPPVEPIVGLLSKDYARSRFEQIDWRHNNAGTRPGDPYQFQEGSNPYLVLLKQWTPIPPAADAEGEAGFQQASLLPHDQAFVAGTTSIQAADKEGWIVSITPSGGWIPAFIAGNTGIGLSQRMQSFVLDKRMNPYNVLQPGQRPRATLTPGMAMKNGKPYLSFAVQGGDMQDQALLQFFLNVTEFGMGVQQAAEAANIISYQMQSSFGAHESQPGRLILRADTPQPTRDALSGMNYSIETRARTSGPITAIYFDNEHGTFWGAASNFGEDYGIGW